MLAQYGGYALMPVPKKPLSPLGKKLDDLLKQRDLSVAELARDADLSRNQIYLIRKGESGTSQDTLSRVVKSLDKFSKVKTDDIIELFKLAELIVPHDLLPQASELTYIYDAEPVRTNNYDGGASGVPELYGDLSPDGQEFADSLVRQIWEREQKAKTTHGKRVE